MVLLAARVDPPPRAQRAQLKERELAAAEMQPAMTEERVDPYEAWLPRMREMGFKV